jgi:hypothetical protein
LEDNEPGLRVRLRFGASEIAPRERSAVA